MTNEELDAGRAEEALRLWLSQAGKPREFSAVEIAARLAREGWVPVDPDLLAARDIVIAANADWGNEAWTDAVREGQRDKHREIKIALAAYKAGKASNAR